MASRISRGEMMMQIACVVAQRGTCDRADVGCVITLDGRIVSIGYVGTPPGSEHCLGDDCPGRHTGCLRTQHAEANAIAWAARKGISVEGGVMYVTLEPCLGCAKLIAMAGIGAVVYLEPYRSHDGIEFLSEAGVDVFEYSRLEEPQ